MFGKIVNHTNNYAVFKRDKIRTKSNDPEYADPRWSDTSVPEMRALFGINIFMGVSTLQQYHLYWHKDKFIRNADVKDTMTLKRHEKLMQYLHVLDRATEPTGQNHDKLYKIQPVLKMVQDSFKAHYNPGKNQTVDEAMIGFKWKLSYVQDLPAKPIKHGIKVWMRCNSESAYLHEFDVYLGHQQNSIHGLAYDVVMKLCQHIAGKNHHLYCDN